MTYTPANVSGFDPVYLSTFATQGMAGLHQGTRGTVPSSGVYPAGNRIHFAPFFTSRIYSLARWWWLNGATVGTDYVQVGIYDQDLNLFKASPRTLSAGTASQVQYANPGIHGTNIINAVDSVDRSTYTTASVTLKAGVLYLISVNNSHGSSATAINSITGTGAPTFTSRSTTQFNGTLNRESIWSGVPTSDFTGTLAIDFGGVTQTNANWSVDAFYHVDTATNDGIVQNATGTGNSTAPAATLAAFGSANNATFGASGSASIVTSTPESGYLELMDISVSTTQQATNYRPDNDTTYTTTLSGSAQWGACAVEIKSLGTGAIAIPPMRGYLAIHCNGGTATLFRCNAFTNLESNTYIQSSATTGFPQTATLATGGTTFVFGITNRSSP